MNRPQPGVFASVDSVFLKPAPIEPSWILAGQPQARCGSHSTSQDGGSSTSVWECSAGAFKWFFAWDETVLVLEGSVKVTSPDGKTTVMKAGDVGYFAAGTTWVWEIEQYLRKVAFCSRPASRPERLLRAARDKLGTHAMPIKIGIGITAAAMAVMFAFE
jgi:uncharacterized cupin superfamily protein